MRTNLKAHAIGAEQHRLPAPGVVHQFAPAAGDDPGSEEEKAPSKAGQRDELPYRVELWDEKKSAVEQVLAVTRNGSIGYAAYYEATRQFPNRYVTLRHKGRILSRFNGPTH
jgi:hypothetical protein